MRWLISLLLFLVLISSTAVAAVPTDLVLPKDVLRVLKNQPLEPIGDNAPLTPEFIWQVWETEAILDYLDQFDEVEVIMMPDFAIIFSKFAPPRYVIPALYFEGEEAYTTGEPETEVRTNLKTGQLECPDIAACQEIRDRLNDLSVGLFWQQLKHTLVLYNEIRTH